MNDPKNIQEVFKGYGAAVDTFLKAQLYKCPQLDLYGHMAYAMGFCDENLAPVENYGGKRLRPGLCLMLAEGYGKREEAMPVAVSVELFHNFTLIHDDIVDADTHRRGRKTVWNVFGTDHAINSGDCMAILAYRVLADALAQGVVDDPSLLSYIYGQYQRVGEGQFLDFRLTEAKLGDEGIDEAAYFEMIARKSADLISAATKGAGLAAGVAVNEAAMLHDLGQQLGIAYQISDDVVSIWATSDATGKRALGDILEKKKTLPVLYALARLSGAKRERLLELYNTEAALSEEQAREVVALLDSLDTRKAMRVQIDTYATAAKDAVNALALSDERKEMLRAIVDVLLPETHRS